MKRQDLDHLRCPDCYHPLELDVSEEAGGCIYTGSLGCPGCSRIYPVHTGVAMLAVVDGSWEPMLREKIARLEITRQLASSGFEKDRLLDTEAGNEANREVMADLFADAVRDIEIREGIRVLDVGAGLCENSAYFASAGAEVVAQDVDLFHLQYPVFGGRANFDDAALREATGEFVGGDYFMRVLADVHRLPHEDATFDIVFCRSTIHHLESRFRAVKEMARVTRPGGQMLLISEPTRSVMDREIEYLEGIFDYDQGLNEQTLPVTSYTLPMRLFCKDVAVTYSRPGCMAGTRKFMKWARVNFDSHFRGGERLGFTRSFKLLFAGCGINVSGTRNSKKARKPGRVPAGEVIAGAADLVMEFTGGAGDPGLAAGEGSLIDHPYAVYRELLKVPREQVEHLRRINDACLDPGDFPESIELGGDCGRFIRGWRQPERGTGIEYRFTGRMASCRLRNKPEAGEIHMLAGTFLSGAGDASVVIRVNGEEAFRFDLPPGEWREIAFPKPRLETRIIEIEIENSSTFVPDEVTGCGDTRELGLPVSRIWQA
jgi:2-polyprenyl-3-methyl-5-hydroxy-6-metoxy-1,4-benzoquinol methylase/uncharacterized protein YbaR (Trm112 family)